MKRRRGNSGFALLLVFAMAAAIAILLYTEMPRVAFEAQRAREQILIDRGEQYQRAIQLFVRKTQRYPARIEDLESTNNIRFLRRRYPDPMTGKDDWRLVHVGPGGVFLDSLVHKPQSPDKDKEKKTENTFVTEALPVGSTLVGQPGAAGGFQTFATTRRASDRAPVAATSMGGLPGGGTLPFDPNAPQQPGTYPAGFQGQTPNPFVPVQPGVYPGQPQQVSPGYATAPPAPGQPYPGMPPVGQQYPGAQPIGQQYPGVQPGLPPGLQAGQQQYPGMQYPNPPANSQTGGQVPFPFPTAVQQPGAPPPGSNPNPALDLIRNLLTSPRQGGAIGTAAQNGGMQMGGGIAGVASKYEAEGIKVYNEKTAYQEWEFIYDPKNDRALGGGTGPGPGRGR